ncbi:MAG: hypothetical protein WC775_00395 [Patescibacteria group bacterium]|jgi:hypothetical protein
MAPKIDLLWEGEVHLPHTKAALAKLRRRLELTPIDELMRIHSTLTTMTIKHHYDLYSDGLEKVELFPAGSIVLARTIYAHAQRFRSRVENRIHVVDAHEPYFSIHLVPFFEDTPSKNRARLLETELLLLTDTLLLTTQLELQSQQNTSTHKIAGSTSPGLRELALRFGFDVSDPFYVNSAPVPIFMGFPVPTIDLFTDDIPATLGCMHATSQKLSAFEHYCRKVGIAAHSARVNAINAFPLPFQAEVI